MSDEFSIDDAVGQTMTRGQAALKDSLSQAVTANPDAEAGFRRDAGIAQVPVDVARALPVDTKQQARMAALDPDALTLRAPHLAQWLTTPDNARISHDDIPQLQQVEHAATALVPPPAAPAPDLGFVDTLLNSARRGLPGLQSSTSANSLQLNAKKLAELDRVESDLAAGKPGPDPTSAQYLTFEQRLPLMSPEQRAQYRATLTKGIEGNASSIATATAEAAKYPQSAIMQKVKDADGWMGAISALMADPVKFVANIGPESLISNIGGMAGAAIAPGSIAVKAGVAGANSFGTDYGSTLLDALSSQGVDVKDPASIIAATKDKAVMQRATAQAIAHASVVGAVDTVSGGVASKLMLPAKVLVKNPLAREITNLVTQTPIQGALGAAGEAGGELAAGQPLDPSSILAEAAGEAFSAPAEVASIASGAVKERMAAANEAKAHAETLKTYLDGATASVTRERAPDAFADLQEHGAAQSKEMFISAASFAQSVKPEQIATLPADVQDQVAEALATGGDIAIKLSDIAAYLPDVHGLVENLRESPEAMTEQEAKDYKPDEHLAEELDKLMPSEASPDARTAALATAKQTVSDALDQAGRFTPQVNAHYADLVHSFISTQAERNGLTPEQIAEMTPRVVSTLGPGLDSLQQADRGAFEPSSKTIALLDTADLSTFLHESGHFFLHASLEHASAELAPEGVKADAQALLDWFGVADLATWKAMSLEEQRDSHEKFARGFEAYLREGHAPTQDLQGMFSRFRGWLLSIYKMMKSLNVTLTPEVRGVMDRMLASDEAIAATLEQRNLQPLFETAQAAGMSLEEFQKYQANGQRATDAAVAKLESASIRDMQLISNAKKRATSSINRQAKEQRAAIEAEVTAEVYAQPIFQAWRDLSRGKNEEGQKVRLMRADIETNYPGQKVPENMMTSTDTALPADLLADAYGLSSGDELVKLLSTLDKPADIIEGRTDQLMLERHGELADAQAIDAAANAAVASRARARILATEANALASAVGERGILMSAARQLAEAAVARRKVRELRPGQYTAAESRAGKAAFDAFKKGDVAAAALAKRTQLLQHVLGRTTADAVAEMKKAAEYLGKFDNAVTRKAIGPEYAEQIDQILENVELKQSTSLKAIDKRKSLAAWVAAQEAIGFTPAIDERLLTDAKQTSYKEMTVEQLRGIVDTVKNIEHLGRLKERLLTARDKRTFAETVGAIADSIREHGGKVRDIDLEGAKGVMPWLEGVMAQHRKIGSLAHQMDGGKDDGPMWNAIVRPMNDASTHEQVLVEQATEKLAALYKPISKLKGGINGAKVFVSEINASLSRAGRLSVALNWGNDGNRQRLMDGDHWSEAQVEAIIKTLSPVELQFVNHVHEFIDSYWEQIRSQQLRISGVVEEKVQATPWTATAADGTQIAMRGGYYPAKYDRDRSIKADQHDAAQVAKEMLQGAYVRATTRRGFTKARAEAVKNQPLSKDLNVITQHVTEVTHNLAWQEWLIDANRLLGSREVKGAMRAHYGPAVDRTIGDDVKGIAAGDVATKTAIDTALMKLRGNITRSTLAGSFTTALMQPFGLTLSVARIGAVPVLRGMARWAGDATRMESSLSWINDKSDFMRLRAKTFNRELNEISGRVGGKSQTMERVDAGLMYLTSKAQQIVDIPTWIGRYQQAIEQGMDEAKAVAQADQAVISSQGGGQTKDLSEVQRKHPFLTQFYSYFNTTLNLTAEKTAATDFKNPKAVAGWLADMALLTVIPAIGPAIVTELLRGTDMSDPDKWAKKLAQWQASYLMGMVVGVREFSGLVSGFSYSGPPVSRIITDVGKVGQQAAQGDIDEPAVMAVIRLLGSAFGIPTVQAVRSYKGWLAWSEGDAPISAVLMGPPSKD